MRLGLRQAMLGAGCAAVLAFGAAAYAAESRDAHLKAAADAAGPDLRGILSICNPRTAGRAPVNANVTVEPVKVFDNLYFLGIQNVSAWALQTSAGIIVLDALDNPGEAQQYIEGGLRKLGEAPYISRQMSLKS